MRIAKLEAKDLRIGDRIVLDSGQYIIRIVRVTPSNTGFDVVYRNNTTAQLHTLPLAADAIVSIQLG